MAAAKTSRPGASHDAGASRARLAVRSRAAIVLFAVVTVVGLGADLITKHYAFEALLSQPDLADRVQDVRTFRGPEAPADTVLRSLRLQRRLCPGVKLTLSTNPGVVFGLPVPRWLVAVATILAIGLVGYFFATSEAGAVVGHVALACILGGALGNLYDRMFSHVILPGMEPIRYQVRDFIDCSELNYPWIYNVADMLLVIGVALLALQWVRQSIHQARAARTRKTKA